jgi:hypothetical protein
MAVLPYFPAEFYILRVNARRLPLVPIRNQGLSALAAMVSESQKKQKRGKLKV